jgi:hypothetical protein
MLRRRAGINLVRKYQNHPGTAPTLLYNESPGGKPGCFAMQNGYENGRYKALTL